MVATALLGSGLSAQPVGTAGYFRPLGKTFFGRCDDVVAAGKAMSRDIPDHSFVLQLYPIENPSLFEPFPSDTILSRLAFRWMGSHSTNVPYALLYSVDSAYAFRCRDNQGRFTEDTGLFQLALSNGQATIWHFWVTTQNLVHAYVVTDIPLEQVNGTELMAKVKERLHAGYLILYARNDPWFLGYSPDPLPYVFADSYRKITPEGYQDTKTLVCESPAGCRVSRSRE